MFKKREPTVEFATLSAAERIQLFHSVVDDAYGLATWENWPEERRIRESLALNPALHRLGLHADFDTDRNVLRLRLVLRVSTIRETVEKTRGETFSDGQIVEEFRSLFPDVGIADLDIDGLPELCLLGDWARLGIR